MADEAKQESEKKQILRQAAEAMRERCAEVADGYADAAHRLQVSKERNSRCIAAAIRALEIGQQE